MLLNILNRSLSLTTIKFDIVIYYVDIYDTIIVYAYIHIVHFG